MLRNKTIKTFFTLLVALLFTNSSLFLYANEELYLGSKHKTQPIPYSEIDIDSIQEYIIDNEQKLKEVYGSYPQNYLVGMSLRAFKAWSEKFTGKYIPVTVFKIQEPDYDESANPWENEDYMNNADIDSIMGYKQELCEDDEDERADKIAAIKTKTYFEELPFKSYPQYGDCNVEELLSGNNIIVNVSTFPWLMEICESCIVSIKAIIPDDKDKESFIYQRFQYVYRPHIVKTYELSDDGMKETHFIERIIKDPTKLVNKDGDLAPYALSENFEWRLRELSSSAPKTVRFTQENMPTTIEELFNYLRKLR